MKEIGKLSISFSIFQFRFDIDARQLIVKRLDVILYFIFSYMENANNSGLSFAGIM